MKMFLASMLIVISLLGIESAAAGCDGMERWMNPLVGEPIAWQGGNVSGAQALDVFNLSIDGEGQTGLNRSREYTPVNATALRGNLAGVWPNSLTGGDLILVEDHGKLGFALITGRELFRTIAGIECRVSYGVTVNFA